MCFFLILFLEKINELEGVLGFVWGSQHGQKQLTEETQFLSARFVLSFMWKILKNNMY